MALDPNIILAGRVPDVSQPLMRGLATAQSIQQMRQQEAEFQRQSELFPLEKQVTEQQLAASKAGTQNLESQIAQRQEEMNVLTDATVAMRAMPSIEQKDAVGFAQTVSQYYPADVADYLNAKAEAGQWNDLRKIGNSSITLARDRGLLGTQNQGYVSDLQRFMSATPEEQAQILKFKRGSSIKEIAGVPHVKDEMSGEWIPLTTTAQINAQEAAKSGASKLGGATGQDIADLESQWSTFSARKDAINDAYPDLEITNLLKKAPSSTLAQAFYQGASKVLGPMAETDALALLGQYTQALVSSVPFAPGSQSDKEMQARERRAAVDQILNSSISVNAKLQAITNFMRIEETTSRRGFEEAQKKKKEYGIAPPSETSLPPVPAGTSGNVDLNAPIPSAGGGGQNLYEVDY